jgi:hypothetical protein
VEKEKKLLDRRTTTKTTTFITHVGASNVGRRIDAA